MEGPALIRSPDGRWWWDGARWRPLAAQVQARYASGAVRAAYATAFLAALILVQAVATVDHLYDSFMFLSALNGGGPVTFAGYATINAGFFILWSVSIGCWVCAVVAFAMWLRRAVANLPALGARELRFTPGWAVGWWFVPLANLVVPLLIMVELWRASDPRVAATDGATRSRLSVGFAIPICWASWLVLLAFLALGGVFGTAYTDREKLVLFAVAAVQSIATAVCFAFTIVVVQLIEVRQARKQSLLEGGTQTGD
jgi:uncharacterized protein DUF4328